MRNGVLKSQKFVRMLPHCITKIPLLFSTLFLLLLGVSQVQAQIPPDDASLSANLLVWYDANDATTLFTDLAGTAAAGDNGLVRLWKNKSTLPAGVGIDLEVFDPSVDSGDGADNNRPTYKLGSSNPGDFNGNNYLSFTGTQTLLADLAYGHADATIFMVVTPTGAPDTTQDRGIISFNNARADNSIAVLRRRTANEFAIVNQDATGGYNNTKFRAYETDVLQLFSFTFNKKGADDEWISYADGVEVLDQPGAEVEGTTFPKIMLNLNLSQERPIEVNIAEIVFYNRVLTDCELENLNLYMGNKYGRDFTGIGDNYDFAGTNAEEVTGIGAFTSVACGSTTFINNATSSILTLDSPSANNTAGEYLTLGHDNSGYSTSTEVPTGYTNRITQEWRIDEDGDIGTVTASFDLAAAGIVSRDLFDFALLVDADGDFSDATIAGTASISGDIVSFSGVDFANGDYVSLAIKTTATPFITAWAVDVSVDPNITIVAYNSIGTPGAAMQNFTVDWGDGSPLENYTGLASAIQTETTVSPLAGITHTYSTDSPIGPDPGYADDPGYKVKIYSTGSFRMAMQGTDDKDKLIAIDQWGSIPWRTLRNGYWGCTNLILNALDVPDLSALSDKSFVSSFRSCTALIDTKDVMGTWNVSTVTLFNNMFLSASNFNEDISAWNTSGANNFSSMFSHASVFNFGADPGDNQKTISWAVTGNLKNMFQNANAFNQKIAGWDMSGVTNTQNMFAGVTLSTANYDAILIAWAAQTLNASNANFSGGNSTYCAGEAARAVIDATWGTMVDGGLDVDCLKVEFDAATFTHVGEETNITGNILVRSGGLSTVASTVDVVLADGASNPAEVGDDYTAGPLTVTIPVADYSAGVLRPFTITIADDAVVESAETIDLSLGNYTGAAVLGDSDSGGTDQSTAIATIVDNDDPILVFTTEPANTVNGETMGTIVVAIQDGAGNTITSATDNITIAINNNPGTGTLSGTVTIAAVSGVATFSTLSIDEVGQDYTIDATATGLRTGTSSAFDITLPLFITAWAVDISVDASITLPLTNNITAGAIYDFTVDWGDGSPLETYTDTGLAINLETTVSPVAGATHTYLADSPMGGYKISISGDLPTISFSGTADKDKIIAVDQWGGIEWLGFVGPFSGCSNLVINATDTPDFSNMTDNRTSSAFFNCTNLVDNGGAMGSWDVSAITNFSTMFRGASSFNGDISGWTTTAATSFANMFNGATAFNSGPGNKTINWDLNGVTSINRMFEGATSFNQDVSGWTTTTVANMSQLFDGATSFDQDLSSWNVEAVTNADLIFNGITLSTANYDALLISWSAQTLTGTGNFSGGNSTYCAGEAARAIIDATWGTLTDGGLDVDCLKVEFDAATFTHVDEETNITGNLRVRSGGLSTVASTVDVVLANGASNPAEVGDDYTAGPLTVTIPVADYSAGVLRPFSITIADDAVVESAETIDLTLGNFTGAAVLGDANSGGSNQSTAIATIVDNDAEITYSVVSAFTEASTNDGAIDGNMTATLNNDTFVLSTGDLVKDTHYTVANIPAGLVAKVTMSSSTVATLTFTGTATAHTDTEDIANATLTFIDAAFTTVTAANTANNSKADIAIDFNDAPSIAYSGTFTETAANDGTVGGSMTATLTGGTFVQSTGDLALTTHYTVANVPSGLIAKVTMTSATVATLTFTGTAATHTTTQDVSNVTLTFTDTAINLVDVANVTDSSKADIAITFSNASSIVYASNFTESLDNNGSMSGSRTATITGDTFTNPGGTLLPAKYSISNLPAGLTASITVNAGGTVATLSLASTATLHTISDGITNLGITFNDAAFANETAAVITTSSNTTGTITYYDAANIVYAGDYTELPANDGSVTGLRTATLTGDLFTDAGGVMTASKYTLSNVPAGLNAVVAVNPGGTEARISISANATTHEAANSISNLGLTFNDGAFATFNAAGVTNNSNGSGGITFYNASGITYAGDFTESGDNDGSLTGTRTATLTGDTFTEAGGTMTATSYTITNLPASLTASVAINALGTVATLSISGTADAHTSGDDIANLSIAFNDAAFTTQPAAAVVNSSNTTGAISYYNAASVAYSDNFTESLDNDGSVTGTRTVTLSGDTFKATLASGTDYTITNVPTGLTAVLTRDSGTVASITLTNTADDHELTNNIANLSITFNDTAFTTLNAAGVATSSNAAGTITYYNAASIVYAGDFTEAVANDGSITGTRTATISGETFTDQGATLNASKYMISNLPASLAASVAINGGGTVATITITGTADAHVSANDVANLGIAFGDTAFTTLNAAGVTDNSNTTGKISYFDAAGITYAGNFTESGDNNGSISGTRTATVLGDVFTEAGGTMTATSYTITNLPASLSASVSINGGGTVATLSISGTADAHTSGDDIANLSIAFNDAAFTTQPAAVIANSSNTTGTISYYNAASVSYSGNFTESLDNDGSVTGNRTATLLGDTFTDAGTTLTATSYSISNLPASLTASIAVNGGGTVATISISGTADDHELTNNIANLSITFNDAAFANLNAAGVATSSNTAGTITYYDAASIVYAGDFTEALANDGSVTGTRTATLSGDTFKATLVSSTDYTITNVPTGLTAVLTRTSATVASITLTNNAGSHANSDGIANLNIAFTDTAFTTLNAAGVTNNSNAAGNITYIDASSIVYASNFLETTANEGSVSGSRTATISGDTFTDQGGTLNTAKYTISSLPASLTASIAVNAGGTVATISLSGTATAHEVTNDVSDLTISFNDTAFTNETAAVIATSSNATGTINFIDASSIVYAGNFTEAGANDGTVTGTRTATITGDVFANAGATMPGTSYSIGNLPAGLTASIAVNAGGTVATLSLGSTATDHEGTHSISNLTITFADAAFINETAANIATSSNAIGTVTFTHNDDDGDGVVNVNDTCPGTSAGLAVDINGCATIAGIIAASDDPADGGFSITDLDDLLITGLTAANITSYEEAIANAMPAPSSVGDLQTIINAVNTTNSVFIKILEDSASTGGANNTDGTAVTAAELASIAGIADVNLVNEAAYQTAIQAATGLSNLPTLAEVQAIITSVNDTIDLVTGADNPADGTPSIGELTTLGITGMGTLTQEDIEETIANAVPQPTTLAELQQLIDDLVTEVADITAIIAQADDPADGTPSLADLTGVGVDVGTLSQEDLEVAIANAIPVPSTVEELQELVDALKVEVATITGIVGPATNPGTGSPSLLDLTNIGISTGTLTQEQIEEEIAKAMPQPTTAEELQDLIDALAVEVTAVTGIIGQADDPADGTPSIGSLTAIGITTGTLTQDQIEIAIANAMPVPTTADELQELINDLGDEVEAVGTLITGANDPADGTPSLEDLTNIGVVTGTLTQEQIEEQIANAMPQPTTVEELQELIDDLQVEVTVVTGIIGQATDPADGTPSIIDLTNIGVVVPGGLTQEQIEETIANADPTPTTVAELQELLEDLEDEVTGIGVLVTNANDPADGNPSITDLTNIGVVVPGGLTQEQIEIAITYADPVPTTTAELQELIDALADEVTAITGVIDQASDPADGTPSIVDLVNIGITGIGTLTQEDIEVTIANADPAPTTVAELQQLLDDLLVEVAEVSSVVTVATSPASGSPSIADLTGIGVVDLVDANQSLYEEAIADADPVPSTLSELQAIIDMINSNQAALAELLEDSASTGGGNNGNGIAITSDQLSNIVGLSDIDPAYEAAYQAAIQNETGFSNPPTLAEIQALIAQVNIESNVLAEILEDSNSTGGDNNANGVTVTIADLQKITGLENLDAEHEAAYQAAIQSAISLSNPPTLAELQSLIDDVNTVENITTVKPSDVIGTKNGVRTPWKIAGLEAYPNNKVSVYNKWGKAVLEAKSYQNDWEGFYKENSKPLPEGSYLYTIDLNGDGSKVVTGWIYIGK